MEADTSTYNSERPKPRKQNLSSPIRRVRNVAPLDRIMLFVRAGGRCEFDGCNRYLLEHHLTLTEGNFAEMAHVVAFKPDGPRGREGTRPADINDVNNLMLLCPQCHKLIDDHPAEYTRRTLEEYKARHERRINHVTGLGPDQKTSVLVLKANIGTQAVTVAFDQILEAVSPRYPCSRPGTTIDLTQVDGNGPAFLKTACDTIKRRIHQLLEPGGEVSETGHISLFALAPIPLLVFLGCQLSNKVPLDLYQRHRDTETWTWKRDAKPVDYQFRRLRSGTRRDNVALVLSLSGTVRLRDLPRSLDSRYSVYELTLKDVVPKTTFLRTRQDLENFRNAYQSALGIIVRDHGMIKKIHLFPAVPAPIAVLCGRELLPKVHPALLVYDYDKAKVGFINQLEVNTNER
jgi:hypothetical protein